MDLSNPTIRVKIAAAAALPRDNDVIAHLIPPDFKKRPVVVDLTGRLQGPLAEEFPDRACDGDGSMIPGLSVLWSKLGLKSNEDPMGMEFPGSRNTMTIGTMMTEEPCYSPDGRGNKHGIRRNGNHPYGPGVFAGKVAALKGGLEHTKASSVPASAGTVSLATMTTMAM